jgi:lysophospholipase L1-like esterase
VTGLTKYTWEFPVRLPLLLLLVVPPLHADEPAWVAPMKDVHAKFKGTPGTLATFGDSITVTMAFWAPLQGKPRNMPDEMAAALDSVKGHMKPDCWAKWKGPKYGSEGGMTIRWADENVDQWLKKLNPEAAVILFGTNDLASLDRKEFQAKTASVVDRCLNNGTVVLLTTLPARSGALEKAKDFAEAVREVATEKKVPLIDYQAEILKRRPDDWDGTLLKFMEVKGSEYEVPTLIARDGVHPSFPKAYQDYSANSLSKSGYSLRNYLTVVAYADVIKRVLKK